MPKANRRNDLENVTDRSQRLNLLEVLLLTLVKSGVTTPYDLVSYAGLSVGNTSPVLKRLNQAGLLRHQPGPRKRVDYSLSPKGEQQLRKALETGRTDYWGLGGASTYDSATRAVFLLWIHYGRGEADKCVDFAISELRRQSQARKREAEELRHSLLDTTLTQALFSRGRLAATAYWFLKTDVDSTLLDIQADALQSLGKILPILPESLRVSGANPNIS